MFTVENQSIFSNNSLTNELYCPTLFDNLCWPQTPANNSVTVSCSTLRMQGVDSSKYITRHCLSTGQWSNVSYQPCVYPDVWELMMRFYASRAVQERKAYTNILQAVRIIELVGLSVSLISVLVSLLIFFSLKSLCCNRTKIHINLLLAIFIQIVVRIINYGIQMKPSNSSQNVEAPRCPIDDSAPAYKQTSFIQNLCPLIIIFLQFSITSMFMWMLCEGIHLNNVLTVGVFKNHFKTYYFYILGWVVPFCITLSWSIIMFVKERGRVCWANYNHLMYYWIIEGPRYAVIIINIMFLLNIIRILMVKIKEGSEKQIREDKHRRGSMNTKFVKKAVKAAVFLLPLLGITHMLETFVSPDNRSIPLFALYCTVTYFLVTFQGFFCSLLYCFVNVEVRETLSRRIQATQIWARWKRCLAKNDKYRDVKLNRDDPIRLELLNPQINVEQKQDVLETKVSILTNKNTVTFKNPDDADC